MDVRGSGPEVKAANFAFTSVQLLYALQKKLLCVRMWPTPFNILLASFSWNYSDDVMMIVA